MRRPAIEPTLLDDVVDVALRLTAHYIAVEDWHRADTWAGVYFSLETARLGKHD